MKIFLAFVLLLLSTGGAFAFYTRHQVARIEAAHPSVGAFSGPAGARTHYLEVPGDTGQPVVLFVHGASGNLLDQHGAFGEAIAGKARGIFVDRPGYGYSERGGADDPEKQAARYVALLDDLGVEKAVLVGHSLGAASVAAMAVLYPERVQGVVFLAPATHPWPGGVTWYYRVAATPLLGQLFTRTLVMPVGLRSLEGGARATFAPNPMPEGYTDKTATALILRPASFEANADDVSSLNRWARGFSPRYSEIKAPTVIITGDQDDIVAPSIHSVGLEKAIEGSELIVLEGVGHKPDYVGRDVVVKAILRVAKGR
ncbi:alpha/beta hydrolase [Rhizobiaceae bacterium]|nr:alpha/beta hydrolase [Rhizobiaceae bacterium]